MHHSAMEIPRRSTVVVVCSSPVAASRRSCGATCGVELRAVVPCGQVQSPDALVQRSSVDPRTTLSSPPARRSPTRAVPVGTSIRVTKAVVLTFEMVAVSGSALIDADPPSTRWIWPGVA